MFTPSNKHKEIWGNLFVYGFLVFLTLALTQPYTGLYRVLFYLAAIPLLVILVQQFKFFLNTSAEHTALLSGLGLIVFLMATTLWTPLDVEDPFKLVRKGLQTLLFFFAAYLFGQQCRSQPQIIGILLQLILCSSLSISLWYYYQYTSYPLRISGLSRILQNPIQGSQIFTVLLLVSIFLKRNHTLFLTIFTALLTFLYIFLSNSRGTIFSLFIASTLVGLFSYRITLKLKLFILLCIAAIASIGILISDINTYLFSREFHRISIWTATLSHLEGHWLLGRGYADSFQTSLAGIDSAARTNHNYIMHPHSLYISTLYHGGITTLALLIFFLSTLIYRLRHKGIALLTLLFIFLACGSDNSYLFSSVKEIWFIFWLPIGLIIGYSATPKREENLHATD